MVENSEIKETPQVPILNFDPLSEIWSSNYGFSKIIQQVWRHIDSKSKWSETVNNKVEIGN